MTDPWFSTEVYAVMPGLIAGMAAGGYGVVIGLLINSKSFKRVFPVMTILASLICLGTIGFGVLAMLNGQPEGTLEDFASAGIIGLLVVTVVYRFISKMAFSDDRKPDDGKPDDGKPDDGKPDNGK